MKVLLANKFFFPKGGDAIAFFGTAGLLKKHGHEPLFFSMQDPRNLPSPFSKYFVSNKDLEGGGAGRLKAAADILYSFEAKKKIKRLIEDERPDIAHLHNICHQISPSIIDALKKKSIPVVMTLHDYKLTCPVYTLFHGGAACEECAGGRYYRAFSNRCTKGSAVKSAINVLEMYLHHRVMHIYERVDTFISPSRFLLEKTREMGFRGRIVHLPNFVDSASFAPSYSFEERSIVYFGRLSREKGLTTLLEAAKGLDATVKIIGEGPQKEELLEKASREGIGNVVFLGFRKGKELHDEIKRSMFAVVPSQWYENNPLSVLEAFALGKPVIGSRIGGIPELVRDDETGLTFAHGEAQDLRDKINSLIDDAGSITGMGRRARGLVENDFNQAAHYDKLMSIYRSVLERDGE